MERLKNCPLCTRSLQQAGLAFRHDGFDVVQCRSCGLVMVNPRPTLSEIADYYPKTYYTHFSTPDTLRTRVQDRMRLELGGYPLLKENLGVRIFYRIVSNLIKHQISLVIPYCGGGRLLDVGCGNGELLRWAKNAGWEAWGVDSDQDAVKLARDVGDQVLLGTVESDELPSSYFDVVNLMQVLEHCHDPMGTLRECYRIIKPGGMLIVSVPNYNCIDRKIYGLYWLGIQTPIHLFHFSPSSLKQILGVAGFKIERTIYKAWFSTSEKASYKRLRYAYHGRGLFLLLKAPPIVAIRKVWKRISGAPLSDLSPFMTVYARKKGRD